MNVSSTLRRWLPFLRTPFEHPRRRELPHLRKRRLRFECLEDRSLLTVSAFDDPSSFLDPHYQTHATTPLAIAAEYGVLANDIGSQLAVISHDGQSHYGADV